ncbi:unnamed protein product [Knipowitschia caucasica]|uniref:Uncharacterized protein n=1 Tax=Knipowitschia caucasica TaxID=637954 RepID=A0AAV2K4M3_KNICA
MALDPYYDMIADMARNGLSSTEILANLGVHGSGKGFSTRNIRKYCAANGISLGIPHARLELEVAQAIMETGPSFGRRMMKGYLSTKNVHAGEARIGSVLRTIHRPYHEDRRQGSKNLNPIPYTAEYMGHKIHLDQNEKIAMFGATHVLAIDGFSRMIVGFSTMPIKNNLLIYENVFRIT